MADRANLRIGETLDASPRDPPRRIPSRCRQPHRSRQADSPRTHAMRVHAHVTTRNTQNKRSASARILGTRAREGLARRSYSISVLPENGAASASSLSLSLLLSLFSLLSRPSSKVPRRVLRAASTPDFPARRSVYIRRIAARDPYSQPQKPAGRCKCKIINSDLFDNKCQTKNSRK